MIIPDNSAKINTWNKHKKYSVRVAQHFSVAALGIPSLRKRAERMRNCGQKLLYRIENGHIVFAGATLCRDRLCPLCAWRLAIKRMGETINTINLLAKNEPDTKAIHVVLTIENVPVKELRSALLKISQGFTRMKKLRLFKEYVRGYMRSMEITYNPDTNTYHPHIHAICIVPSWYTKQISFGDWMDMWQDSTRTPYRPIIWVRQAYLKYESYYGEDGLETSISEELPTKAAAAIVEATKYACSPEGITSVSEAGHIHELAKAIQGIRMISFGGNIKKYRKELGYTDRDKPDEQLPPTVINPDEGIDRYYLAYEWCAAQGRYIAELRQSIDERAFLVV